MKFLIRCAPLALLLFSSCDLETIPNPTAEKRPADHLVINEVYTLPVTSSNPFSWIEVLNPTDKPVGNLGSFMVVSVVDQGPAGQSYWMQPLSFRQIATGELIDTLEPGGLLVLATDSIRFYNHYNLGPGTGPGIYCDRHFLFERVQGGIPTAIVESGQILLLDSLSTPIDLVRYGNYVSSAVPDPYPGNRSAGLIPNGYSLSRYAGGFFTGNSADDFYMESRPIPMWYSELNHP